MSGTRLAEKEWHISIGGNKMNRQKENTLSILASAQDAPLARREREEERRFFFDGLLSTFIANINDGNID